MTEELEGTELETTSDASAESSSETPSKETPETEASTEESAAGIKTDNTPFHEHPRFKELVEQKNQALSAQKALEEKYAQMEAQFKKITESPKSTEAKTDAIIERLRGIDPEFAARMEQLSKALPQVEQMQQRLQAYERQQEVQQAVGTINSLHEQNKVSPELKTFINNELDRLYMQGKLRGPDVPAAYKAIYDQYSRFVDGIKRTERESYVASKKADSKAPTSQPKGAPARQGNQKPQFSKDPEIARQQVVSRYLKQAKAESDI